MNMKRVVLGFCLGTIGIAALSSASDIIVNLTELAKAKIAVQITKCNNEINSLSIEEEPTRAIGFDITAEEDDNDE